MRYGLKICDDQANPGSYIDMETVVTPLIPLDDPYEDGLEEQLPEMIEQEVEEWIKKEISNRSWYDDFCEVTVNLADYEISVSYDDRGYFGATLAITLYAPEDGAYQGDDADEMAVDPSEYIMMQVANEICEIFNEGWFGCGYADVIPKSIDFICEKMIYEEDAA